MIIYPMRENIYTLTLHSPGSKSAVKLRLVD